MRQIKFRGKRLDNGQWVYGHYTEGSPDYHYIANPDGSVWQIAPETLGQFTGLLDKAGKEIYEGDKARVSWLAELGITELDCEAVGVVVWDDNTCGFHVELDKPYRVGVAEDMSYEETTQPLLKGDEEFGELNISYEVIGNIYGNLELTQS